MIKKFALIACVLALTATYQPPSWAGKVLDRIRETGTITAGTHIQQVILNIFYLI
jgi:polar amino acid transport system substrate-binding protein